MATVEKPKFIIWNKSVIGRHAEIKLLLPDGQVIDLSHNVRDFTVSGDIEGLTEATITFINVELRELDGR